jgi:phosphatidylinositol kinase/protein kinase (PI-3  family)
MRALRAQTAALMSVIGPFVYDPLVSWGRGRSIDTGERTNEQALQHLQHIKQRLNGMVSWLIIQGNLLSVNTTHQYEQISKPNLWNHI